MEDNKTPEMQPDDQLETEKPVAELFDDDGQIEGISGCDRYIYEHEVPFVDTEDFEPSGNTNENIILPTNVPCETDVQPNEKKKTKEVTISKGFLVFFLISVILITFFATVSVINLQSMRASPAAFEEGEIRDTKEMQIYDSPLSEKEINPKSDNKVLTPVQIAEKMKQSNVGISSYNQTKMIGEGTGIVMDEDGTGEYTYIITCAHVIDTVGASISVSFENGEKYDAQIVGYDTKTDIGVLRIKGTGFVAAEFGNSEKLSVGDEVYAIGNPGGSEFFGSFTTGNVSAINRPISSESGYSSKCIQHDASINPGNSGGMLVNKYGQVVGMNSQKIASTEYEGMGFAIPSAVLKRIVDDLIKTGYVPDRAKLGISYYQLSSSSTYSMLAKIKGLPAGSLIIGEIAEDGALAGTDVQKYDIITEVNGKKLDTADTLLEIIENSKPGTKITLTIVRFSADYSDKTFKVNVKLVEDRGNVVVEQNDANYIYPFGEVGD